MRSKPISRRGLWKSAFAKWKLLCNIGNSTSRFFTVSSVPSVVKGFPRFEQGFQHRVHREHRENQQGSCLANFLTRNIRSGGLGRTKGLVGFGCAAFAGSSEAQGAPNRSSRRDVCVLVSAQAGIRDD